MLGTLPYMAPEQVEGLEADARTDIFALGVVLYEMISGAAPFNGDSRASLAAAILTLPSPPLTSRAGSIPAILDRVVQKCLAKKPRAALAERTRLAQALEWGAATPHAIATRRGRRSGTAGAQLPSPLAAIAATLGLAALVLWACDGRRPYSRRAARTGVSDRPPSGEAPSRRPVSRADGQSFATAPAGKTDRGGSTWGVR